MLVLFEGKLGARQTQRFVEEMLNAGHWSWNLETGLMEWSRGLMELLGVEAGTITPCYAEFERAMHPDDRSNQNDIEQMLRDSISVEREFRIVNSSGRVRWIAARAEPIAGPFGVPNRAIGICYDVTRHREELRLLRKSQDRLRALSKLAKVLIWIAKPNGNFMERLNWLDVWPEKTEKVYESTWSALIHPDDALFFNDQWSQAIAAKSSFSVEHRLLEPDGAYGPYWSRALPILDAAGEITEWVGTSLSLQHTAKMFPKRDHLLTGAQIRAARAIVGWSVEQLAVISKVSKSTIRGIEAVDRHIGSHKSELIAIHQALSKEGAEFTFSSDGKPGVRPR
jgi:PAS domain S-box-containing protein